jgi:hypothetical protein
MLQVLNIGNPFEELFKIYLIFKFMLDNTDTKINTHFSDKTADSSVFAASIQCK